MGPPGSVSYVPSCAGAPGRGRRGRASPTTPFHPGEAGGGAPEGGGEGWEAQVVGWSGGAGQFQPRANYQLGGQGAAYSPTPPSTLQFSGGHQYPGAGDQPGHFSPAGSREQSPGDGQYSPRHQHPGPYQSPAGSQYSPAGSYQSPAGSQYSPAGSGYSSREHSPVGHHYTPATQPTPANHQYFPGHHQFSPGSQHYSPGHQQFSPGHQDYSPGSQQFSPGNQYSPGHHQFSPGQNFSPGQQFSPTRYSPYHSPTREGQASRYSPYHSPTREGSARHSPYHSPTREGAAGTSPTFPPEAVSAHLLSPEKRRRRFLPGGGREGRGQDRPKFPWLVKVMSEVKAGERHPGIQVVQASTDGGLLDLGDVSTDLAALGHAIGYNAHPVLRNAVFLEALPWCLVVVCVTWLAGAPGGRGSPSTPTVGTPTMITSPHLVTSIPSMPHLTS